jgi:hypothetical protein
MDIRDGIRFLEDVRNILALLQDTQHESDAGGIGGVRLAAGHFELALPRSF